MDLTAEAFMRTLDRPGLGAGAAPASRCRPTSRTRSARCSRFNEWARRRGGARRQRDHGPARQGREHGNGARRGVAARLAAGALQDQARNRRELQAHAARGDEAGEPRGRAHLGIASHNLFDLAYALVLAAERTRWTRCNSRCSKAWPTTSAARLFEYSPQPAALRAGLPQGEFPQRHRLPHPPARREHRAGELPAARLQHPVGSPDWERLEKGFLDSRSRLCRHGDRRARAARRIASCRRDTSPADRARLARTSSTSPTPTSSLPQNGDWAEQIIVALEAPDGDRRPQIPLVIAGEKIGSTDERRARLPRSVAARRAWSAVTARPPRRTSSAPSHARRPTRTAGARCRASDRFDDPRAGRAGTPPGPRRL